MDNSLPSRVEKLLAPPLDMTDEELDIYEASAARYGVESENARLAPLHKALVDCVTILQSCWACWESKDEPHPRDAALARLEQVVKEMEGGG